MTKAASSSAPASRPGAIAVCAVYFFYAAVVMRTLAHEGIRPRLLIYLALEFLYLLLFTLVLWRSPRRMIWQHSYFVLQSLLVLVILLLRPKFDFIVVLFMLLAFQAAMVFRDQVRWLWVAIQILLIGLPLTIALGVNGLALALLPMTVGIVFPAYVSVTQEIEAGLRSTQALLDELQAANQQLTTYVGQVEELSAIQERNRLARELHDSVSQTIFSICLQTRAAERLLECDPDRVPSQLAQLKELTQSALQEMRGLIANLRPQENGSPRGLRL